MEVGDRTEPAVQQDDVLCDRRFNPWREPATEKARALVDEAVRLLTDYEHHCRLRTRKRKPVDQKTFEATVAAILCDLAYHALTDHGGDVHITRSNRKLGNKRRYRPPALNKKLPAVLDMLASKAMGYIEQNLDPERCFGQSRQTTIKAGWRLLDRLREHGVGLADLRVSDSVEVIILRSPKKHPRDSAEELEYADTADTRRMRDQLRAINRWLGEADIDFDELVEHGMEREVDVGDRRLRRIFGQGRFDRGGRLFGGFWQQMKKQGRLDGLIVDDECIVELDYGQMSPRIVYGLCGAKPATEDLYAIPGYEHCRDGIKLLLNSMLSVDKPLTRFPQGARKLFGPVPRVSDVVAAIEAAHPAIAQRFFTGAIHELQFVESQILVDVLLELKDVEVVALPIHDAILVPFSKRDTAREVMLTCFHRHTGVEGKVSEG